MRSTLAFPGTFSAGSAGAPPGVAAAAAAATAAALLFCALLSALEVLLSVPAPPVSGGVLFGPAEGGAVLVFLLWVRQGLMPLLLRMGFTARSADMLAKAGPVVAIALSTALAWYFQWQNQGLKIVGEVPGGLPPLTLPLWDASLWKSLAMPALLISVVGFVESVSVGQTLAAKRRQRIEPDQELLALGASNIAASLSGGFPVTGGFARSVVNFDAGAQTPAAGVFTALGITLATLFLTPALYYLPQATLAATIVVAVQEGRAVFDNIRKTVVYLLSSNAGEVLSVFFAVVLATPLGLNTGQGFILPLLATQILWINLITDVAPALALGFDPAAPDLMRRAPRSQKDGVINARMLAGIVLVGLVMTAGTLFVFRRSLPEGIVFARTMAFTTIMLFQLFNALNARAGVGSAFRGMFSNRKLWVAVILSLLLQALVIYLPGLQLAFGTAGLRAGDVILRLNNLDVKDARQFNALVAKLEPKKIASVLVRRGDSAQYLTIRPNGQ